MVVVTSVGMVRTYGPVVAALLAPDEGQQG